MTERVINHFDRATGRKVPEPIYAGGFLNWSYNTALGWLATDLVFSRGLGHITRSGVLMLCAAWELYLEELLIESARVIVDRAASPDDLPEKVQKEIAKTVRDSKHELKPLQLAGEVEAKDVL